MNKILILASNPRGDLQLDREVRDLKEALERKIKQQQHQRYEVVFQTAVRPGDLLTLLREHRPRIVHFCGHGTGERGLLFQDDKGREQLVSTEALADLFQFFAQDIECAVFNACTSDRQAQAVVKYVDYAIGMSEEILDRAAYIFAIGFYQGLADGDSIERAYEFGCLAIHIQLQSLNGKTSRSQGLSKERKFEVVDPSERNVNPEHLKPILRKKTTPSFASRNNLEDDLTEHNSESSTKPNIPSGFVKAIAQEVERKEYKDVARETWDRFGEVVPSEGAQPLTKQEYRRRKILLNKVKNFWIEGFLKPSLYADAAINLELKKRPDAVLRPFPGIEELPVELDESFQELQQTDIFNQIGQGKTLLILGEPGSGKTIALLQLAQRLVERTEQDLSQPIPVVFNLSSWPHKRKTIEEWLIEELREKYQVPKQLSQPWIKQGQIILLLDGLDEVQAQHRNACVRVLNQFITTHGMTEMVVCSRVKDYEALTERLQLSSAICIQPMSPKKVYEFLENAGDSLAGLKTLLKRDTELEKFAQTPLILNVMGVTYQGWSTEELLQEFGSPENRYQDLFDAYIERMLGRRGASAKYPKDKVRHWLGWLAKRMVNESQTVFLIEKMQPTWLKDRSERIVYRIRNFLIGGLIFGLIFGLSNGLNVALSNGLILGLAVGLIAGLILGLLREITLFEQMSWSWQRAKSRLIHELGLGLIFGLIFGLIVGLIYGWVSEEPSYWLVFALFFGLVGGLSNGLSSGLGGTEVEERTIPNQGIKSSAKNFVIIVSIFGLIVGLILGLILGLIGELSDGETNGDLFMMLIVGLISGVITGLRYGGAACIQHFNLRLMLCQKGRIPWNYARFLNYATECILMKKVGGGYIFYHRMLMEHFAGIKPVATPVNAVPIAQPSTPVPNHLTCSSCGQKNPTVNKFCNKCGMRLS